MLPLSQTWSKNASCHFNSSIFCFIQLWSHIFMSKNSPVAYVENCLFCCKMAKNASFWLICSFLHVLWVYFSKSTCQRWKFIMKQLLFWLQKLENALNSAFEWHKWPWDLDWHTILLAILNSKLTGDFVRKKQFPKNILSSKILGRKEILVDIFFQQREVKQSGQPAAGG